LAPRMVSLARRACSAGIGLTIDAEEADRLDLSLDVIEALARDPVTRGWSGLGLAVQAYGRRAPLGLDWIAALADQTGRRMTVRLVKGAYWDAEIKRAQERGLESFPVYTSKAATDANYAVRAGRPDLPPVRVYAPVGTHEELLPYLVRRLLENGANSSFVHHFLNKQI